MARYNNVLLTEQGRVLLSRVQMGECDLVITRAGTGDRIHGDEIDLTTLTQLGNEIQSFPISAYKRDGSNIKLSFVATNFIPESGTGLEEEYYIQEIGIFARASNEEEEVLYGITKAVAAVHMPAYDEASPTTATFTIKSYVGSSANVVIQESSEAYVPSAQYEEEMELVAEQINELKKSVSDGKSAVASAITAMGVSTESDATFETMATNISGISKDATATASNILSDKTAYSGGKKITGTMVNRGTVEKTLNCGGSYTIPKGYHDGSGKVIANSLAAQTSATAAASAIQAGKTAYVSGSKVTGTYPCKAFNTYTSMKDSDYSNAYKPFENGNLAINASFGLEKYTGFQDAILAGCPEYIAIVYKCKRSDSTTVYSGMTLCKAGMDTWLCPDIPGTKVVFSEGGTSLKIYTGSDASKCLEWAQVHLYKGSVTFGW